jgi:hypothetical protein
MLRRRFAPVGGDERLVMARDLAHAAPKGRERNLSMTEPTVTRTKVQFDSHGVRCAGYLYRPAKAHGLLPCVVLGHGTAGTMDRLFVYAEPFAAAGMAALVFDYRGWGPATASHARSSTSRGSSTTGARRDRLRPQPRRRRPRPDRAVGLLAQRRARGRPGRPTTHRSPPSSPRSPGSATPARPARRRCSPARRSRPPWRPRAWRARCGATSSPPGSCSPCPATSPARWWRGWGCRC